jgi:hypothetical protein
VLTVAPVFGDSSPQIDIPTRGRDAERIVIASVERVRAQYQRNEHGDELIVSSVDLRVDEVLKGAGAGGDILVVQVEGGTIDGVTLRVSDVPSVRPGERAVFFLTRDPRGGFVPHLRGLGILTVDPDGQVRGTSLTVDDVRRMLRQVTR